MLLTRPATTLRCYAISTYMVRFHTWHLLASDLTRLEIYNTVKLRKKCLIWYYYLLAREQAHGFFSWRAPQRSHIISLGVRNALKFMHSKLLHDDWHERVKTMPKTKPTNGKTMAKSNLYNYHSCIQEQTLQMFVWNFLLVLLLYLIYQMK